MHDQEAARIEYEERKPYYIEYYQNNKERMKLAAKKYRRTHFNVRLWYKAKERAKRKGLPFTITKEDIVIPECCPVFGTPLICTEQFTPDTPTLDRLIPELGYVKGNIAVISWRANEIKSTHTFDELQKIVQWMSTFDIIKG